MRCTLQDIAYSAGILILLFGFLLACITLGIGFSVVIDYFLGV